MINYLFFLNVEPIVLLYAFILVIIGLLFILLVDNNFEVQLHFLHFHLLESFFVLLLLPLSIFIHLLLILLSYPLRILSYSNSASYLNLYFFYLLLLFFFKFFLSLFISFQFFLNSHLLSFFYYIFLSVIFFLNSNK